MSEEQEAQEVQEAHRRKHLRSPMIILNIINAGGNKTFFGYGKNISRGGVFISTVNPRETGAHFCLEIPLPAPILKIAQCKCEVVWVRQFSKNSTLEPGMGLKFLNLPESDGEAIERWIRHHQG
jgi:Tfp pilus assembly protein PilZ